MAGRNHTGPKPPNAPKKFRADEPQKPQHFFDSLNESAPLTDLLSGTFAISPTVGEAYRQLLADRAAALVAATTKYTHGDVAEWLEINKTLDQSRSALDRATSIQRQLQLPAVAIRTIRRKIPARKK
jgi:hypothetical protein